MDAQKYVESVINEKKIFISGSGKEFNYSFPPALTVKIYEKYTHMFSDIASAINKQRSELSSKKFMKALYKDVEKLEAYNKDAKALAKKAVEVNDVGMELILVVLNKNPQKFEVSENYVLNEMSRDDMVEFIRLVCVATPDEKKR